MPLEVTITDGHYAMKQACMTVHDYMHSAISDIDEKFGKGYAKAHPELIVAYMRTAAQDYDTTVMKVAAQELRDAYEGIRGSLVPLAEAVTNLRMSD